MSGVVYKKCPKCGANMLTEEGVMTASIPPKYRYHCPLCGEMDFDTEKYPMPEVMHEPIPVMINRLPTDWDAFRRETAKDILCAFLSDRVGGGPNYPEFMAEKALTFADALITRLKEK